MLIKEIYALLDEKEKIPINSNNADDVKKQHLNNNKISEKLNMFHEELNKFTQEVESLKKNKKKNKNNYNLDKLSEKLTLYRESYELQQV